MASDSTPAKQNKPSAKLLVILVLIGVVIIAVLFMQNREKTPASVAKKSETPIAKPEESRGANRPAPALTPPPAEETAPEPESNAERAYLVEDFRDGAKKWDNYKLKNVKISDQGVTLEDGATNGVIESPSLVLKLPSNMVALLWKEEKGDCTDIKPEMQISGDGQNWSAWYPIESTGDDVNPLYPDGSPNPNYGYVPGSYVSLGLDLVPFVRYRVTMSRCGSANPTPALKAIRMYHLDSTLKEGKVATSYPPGPPTPEELKAMQAKAQEEANSLPNNPGGTGAPNSAAP